jgi:hypothetical protein
MKSITSKTFITARCTGALGDVAVDCCFIQPGLLLDVQERWAMSLWNAVLFSLVYCSVYSMTESTIKAMDLYN